MRKIYEGYASPGRHEVRFRLDWSCRHCGGEDVERDPSNQRQLHWCDGGPSTEDQLRYWRCNACGKRTLGHEMKTKLRNLPSRRRS